jgi:hypothetical protein
LYFDMCGHKNETLLRSRVSCIEVFVECFKGRVENFTRNDARNIKDILTSLDWVADSPRTILGYGSQRTFVKR